MGKVGSKIEDLDPNLINLKHFEVLRAIGKGSFGKVNAVIKKNTEQLLAMKTMDKAMIIDKTAVKLVMRERMFWSMFDHPLIIKFHWSFHDDANLYAVVDLMQGGDMRFHLKKEHRFNSSRCKFYVAQLVESCQYIHQLGYLHRDIKPDNILFDHNGNICVTDFNLTKKSWERFTRQSWNEEIYGPRSYSTTKIFISSRLLVYWNCIV